MYLVGPDQTFAATRAEGEKRERKEKKSHGSFGLDPNAFPAELERFFFLFLFSFYFFFGFARGRHGSSGEKF